jgi:protein phosphatase
MNLTDKAIWEIKVCKGPSPGARYGHVMAYLKPYLIIYGGNTGSEAVGDIWKIDITGNATWEKVNPGQ